MIDSPSGPARFVVTFDPDTSRVSKALLVFSDAPVVCGHDVAKVGVDTGLAAFFDRPTLVALNADAAALGRGKDLYDDLFDAQIGTKQVVAKMACLPSRATLPMISSGWGDGGYPVATLNDMAGHVVAISVDFMGRDAEGAWLLPPACSGA